MATPEERLAELGIELPTPPPPAAAYVPFKRTGNLIFTAGQVAGGPDGLVATAPPRPLKPSLRAKTGLLLCMVPPGIQTSGRRR